MRGAIESVRRPSAGVLNHIHTCPYQGGFPSLTLPPAVHIPSAVLRQRHPAPSALLVRGFRDHFCQFPFSSEFRSHQKSTFMAKFAISGRSGVDFRRFWVPKLVPAADFFGVFSKTVILLKSCSRCGGSTVFKV